MSEYTQSKDKLIQGLNEDLAAEWSALIRYTYQVASSNGLLGAELRSLLQNEINDELGHATYLSQTIVDLGGEPTTTPKQVTMKENMREMLEQDLELELMDVAQYTKHAKLAEVLGEIDIKIKLEEMAADEAGHARQIRRLLQGTAVRQLL